MPGFDEHPDSPITLGLSQKPAAVPDQPLPSVDELQFRRAQSDSTRTCAACQSPIAGEFFQVQGKDICSDCAAKIQAGQQNSKKVPLFRAALYGAGAALAGCIIYALIAIIFHLEIGLVAILVGIMVGKAIRKGAYGVGGRPQQILAVTLTYFAITTSYIPVFIYDAAKESAKHEPKGAVTVTTINKASIPTALVAVILLAAAAPFLGLFSGGSFISSLISLFIIFIGLQRAWGLTAKPNILVSGPYS